MQVIIDRFEGDIAVCEKSDRTMINIPIQRLPDMVKEGDVINIEGNVFEIDAAATAKRRQESQRLLGDLKRKDKP
jgi:hypothetical protein